MKTSIIALSTALAVVFLGIFFPSLAEAENPSPNETGVAFTDVEIFNDGGGGSSNKALEYHDLVVTESQNIVTFYNYVNIHDERIETTDYYVEIFIIIVEHDGNEQTEVYKERTDNFYYSPPLQFNDIHYGTIPVNYCGMEYHEYEVISDYDWYEIQTNGEPTKLDFGPKLSEFAIVYEVDDIPDPTMETSV